jgi:crotonobetainyl-CoA:carnitine CoA-transferase CaiB-like acyl-CoA transferase
MESYSPDWYRDMAAGHETVKIDIKSPAGRQQLEGLLATADVMISATRPAAMERLGLDSATLLRNHPRLCQVIIVGYPEPRDNEAGHDLTYQASMGLLDPPHMPRTLLSDMAGSELVISSVLALLYQRERSGNGGYSQVALSEAAAIIAEPLRYGLTPPGEILGGGIPEYNIYKTSDGWVAVAALEPHFKRRLEDALKVSVPEEYRAAFVLQSSAHWQEWGKQFDVPIETVRDR